MAWAASSFLSFRSLCFLICSFISPGSAKIINDSTMHSNSSLLEAPSKAYFRESENMIGGTTAAKAFEVMREKKARVKQEVRVIAEREVLIFRDLMRFRILFIWVFMVGVTSCVSIYNIFMFIIAGCCWRCKVNGTGKGGGTVGGSSKVGAKAVGPVPVLSEAEKREIQKKMIEELFRRYYPYSDFFGWK